MKKMKMILGMLFFAAVASMNGQEAVIPDGPRMMVQGNLVNTGKIKSEIPTELKGSGAVVNKTSNADFYTAGMIVGEGTTVTNEDEATLIIGVAPTPTPTGIIVPYAAKDYSDTEKGDVAKGWTSSVDNATLQGQTYTLESILEGEWVDAGDLMISEFVYSSDAQVSSKSPGSGTDAYADLSPLSSGIKWADAVIKCANLTENGFDDWYLPNSAELETLGTAGYLGFTSTVAPTDVSYWGSTEYIDYEAWARVFRRESSAHGHVGKSVASDFTGVWVCRCVRRN